MAINLLRVHEPHGTQHLHLLIAQRFCIKGCWRLHCNEGEQLEEVVLQDVAERTSLFVEGATALHADRLRHGDLDMVDVAAVPDRLENEIAKTEDKDVSHRLFSKVVIDAVDLTLAEDLSNFTVELHRRLKVAAERLLNDDASPATLTCLMVEPSGTKTADDLRER